MTFNFDELIDRRGTNSLKWTRHPPDVIPLWVADMDFRSPAPILETLRLMLDHGVLGYEFPRRQTLQAVASRMERLYGWQVDPDWVIATPGVVSGFNIAARAVCANGDGVLVQPPVYHMFYTIYNNVEVTRQDAPITLHAEGNIIRPHLDLNAFRGAFHTEQAQTRMFLLCHPHNPTGQVFTPEELKGMSEACMENETIIVSDEIHSELLLNGSRHTPIATLSPEIADRSITLVAASKTFNTAGLFCAFAIIPNAEVRERFRQANDQITGHVSSVGLAAAEAAFSGACDDWLNELLIYLRENRDFVVEYLTENLPQARFTVPEATCLQFIDFGAYVRSGVVQKAPHEFFLDHAKVALNDGKIFGDGYEHFIRLNFGTPRAVLAEGLERMVRSLK
jgi:cystathionine beta-lyase